MLVLVLASEVLVLVPQVLVLILVTKVLVLVLVLEYESLNLLFYIYGMPACVCKNAMFVVEVQLDVTVRTGLLLRQ